MTGKIPAEVSKVIKKLEANDQEILKNYLAQLSVSGDDDESGPTEQDEGKKSLPKEEAEADDDSEDKEPPFPPVHDSSTSDDPDAAQSHLDEATSLKATGDYAGALDKYTAAVLANSPSASLYANRADCLIRLDRPRAAVRDGDMALARNPDSAKALRLRGRAKKMLADYEGARRDLSASQSIDFDDGAAEDLRFVMGKVRETENVKVRERLEEEERKRRLLEEQRQRQRDAAEKTKQQRQRDAEDDQPNDDTTTPPNAGMPNMPFDGMGGIPGMPSGGMPPGMEGLLGSLMSDPELAVGMRDPKIMGAFKELMSGPGGPMALLSNPQKLQQLMTDPAIGPFFQKLMGKMGMAGMGGGMGGAGTSARGVPADDLDEIPDLDMD